MILEDTDVVVEEILSEQPACEGPTHPEAKYGHRPEEAAAYLVTAPCGLGMFMCASWVHTCHYYTDLYCGTAGCGNYHPWEEVIITPLDIT